MAQYDVYRSSGEALLLDVQAEALSALNTRIVIPLLLSDASPLPIRQLNPVFAIEGRTYVLMTQFLSAVPASELRTLIATLSLEDHNISLALDLLFHGV